ncbi:thioredoxin-dependent thiol peroxidase [Egicoccus halophilus]|uniref:thioredoxin-dependent peroxiredoxin n=1 Tax=Egicoccus halophilus TaxID=1670830 RepID=A0A8J3A9H9_9ACTN|nr:thioredoxin-dependent thiol peroxidase [Egicoccus halophilus]GGI07612.1 peroxiredoxin [Egicoccus halophilus]
MLEAGQPAPDFTLPDQDGEAVSLSQFRGRPVVVYFYPRDNTPGCTTQACDIRDQWAEFEAAGAAVLGISPDSVASHATFRGQHDLPHTLLADPDKTVMEPWGAWGEKVLYGKKTTGVIRSTVLVDAEGNVAKIWKRVQAKKHADQVLKALQDL